MFRARVARTTPCLIVLVVMALSASVAEAGGGDPAAEKFGNRDLSILADVCARRVDSHPRDRWHLMGPGALRSLARGLRSEGRRDCWASICGAIGSIGDRSYADTLRDFIWNRFEGEVDRETLTALRAGQSNIGWLAAGSPKTVDYLLGTAAPAGWAQLPWWGQGWLLEDVARDMAQWSIESLQFVDDRRAATFLDTLSVAWLADFGARAPTADDSTRVRDLRATNATIRKVGLLEWWKSRVTSNSAR